jgi:hypothetical protein
MIVLHVGDDTHSQPLAPTNDVIVLTEPSGEADENLVCCLLRVRFTDASLFSLPVLTLVLGWLSPCRKVWLQEDRWKLCWPKGLQSLNQWKLHKPQGLRSLKKHVQTLSSKKGT